VRHALNPTPSLWQLICAISMVGKHVTKHKRWRGLHLLSFRASPGTRAPSRTMNVPAPRKCRSRGSRGVVIRRKLIRAYSSFRWSDAWTARAQSTGSLTARRPAFALDKK